MNKQAIQEWLKLTEQNKQNIFREVVIGINLPSAAIEKDWWVVRTLALVFASSIEPHTVFKGGTSLSKAWNLIDNQIKKAFGKVYHGKIFSGTI